MKKFKKLFKDIRKFAPKQNPNEKVIPGNSNKELHVMLDKWANPDNRQITTTITVILWLL